MKPSLDSNAVKHSIRQTNCQICPRHLIPVLCTMGALILFNVSLAQETSRIGGTINPSTRFLQEPVENYSGTFKPQGLIRLVPGIQGSVSNGRGWQTGGSNGRLDVDGGIDFWSHMKMRTIELSNKEQNMVAFIQSGVTATATIAAALIGAVTAILIAALKPKSS